MQQLSYALIIYIICFNSERCGSHFCGLFYSLKIQLCERELDLCFMVISHDMMNLLKNDILHKISF